MTTFTIEYAALSRLVTITAPSAAKPASLALPVFEQVRLSCHKGKAQAVATDRYTAAWARSDQPFPKRLAFGLTVADWKHLLATFKPDRLSEGTALRFKVDALTATVTLAQGKLVGPESASLTYSLVEGAWPLPESLLTNAIKADRSGPVRFGVEMLRRLPLRTDAVFVGGEGKPCGFVGKDWAVIVMPQKSTNDEPALLESWADTATSEAVAA